jgi:putative transposase
VLLRLAYLGLTNTFALLRLLPMTDQDKDIEILVLRHQIAVLQRQLGDTRVRFSPTDRALLAALLHRLPRQILHRLRLLVRRIRSRAGIATCSADTTPRHPDRNARAGPAP